MLFRSIVAGRPAAPRHVVRLATGQPPCRLQVVDDMDDNRRFLCQLLHGAGFEVSEAANGAAAVAEFERVQPHGILMDMRMPVMDGVEAIRLIRGREPVRQVKIISLSASVFAANREQAVGVGADDFLGKPFRESDLFAMLGALLGVSYVFSDEPKPAALRPDGPAAPVPREFVPALRRAVEEADLDRVLELIDENAGRDPALAGELRELALRFDYAGLLARLEE